MLNLKTNNINELRVNIAFYLDELNYGIKKDQREFSQMEYINLFFLDVITQFYYSLPDDKKNKERFIDNIQQIINGIVRHNKENHEEISNKTE